MMKQNLPAELLAPWPVVWYHEVGEGRCSLRDQPVFVFYGGFTGTAIAGTAATLALAGGLLGLNFQTLKWFGNVGLS
ncbi:MAG: hypothetical protein JO225_05990, partial [Candidatus Eremiobacteraeota bacterium]|nr:hypothetical protein [Candidatus Eremiobacteraeota bacterium]